MYKGSPYPRIYCSFWEIQDACPTRHIFADWMIVVFTTFMCIWGVVFVELWAPYSAGVTQRWNVGEFDERAEEHPRPEYLMRLKDHCIETANPIMDETESGIRIWTRKMFSLSGSIILIFISLVCVKFTNQFLRYVLDEQKITHIPHDENTPFVQYHSKADVIRDSTYEFKEKFAGVFSIFVRLVSISTSSLIYARLARRFTDLESHRSQIKYDDSLTQKLCMFNFINYYASVLDIVFLRGKLFAGWPGDIHLDLVPRNVGEKIEDGLLAAEAVCGLDGCLGDLRVELVGIMINKQVLNALKEYTRPLISCWWSGRIIQKAKSPDFEHGDAVKLKQWISDSKLQPFGPQAMFPEYIEMVVQFGFVMLFTCAFPLAPLFALLNNIFEVRLDAKKMITFYRRPTPLPRVKRINIWHKIMDLIITVAIFTNSFIIAFLSDTIPKTVYYMLESDLRWLRENYHDYLEFSLAYSGLLYPESCTPEKPGNVCHRLRGAPDTPCWAQFADRQIAAWLRPNYADDDDDIAFWICLAARMSFMVIFQNFLTVLISLIRHYVRPESTFSNSDEGEGGPREGNQSEKSSLRQQRVMLETEV